MVGFDVLSVCSAMRATNAQLAHMNGEPHNHAIFVQFVCLFRFTRGIRPSSATGAFPMLPTSEKPNRAAFNFKMR